MTVSALFSFTPGRYQPKAILSFPKKLIPFNHRTALGMADDEVLCVQPF